jgi:hypothetical protein
VNFRFTQFFDVHTIPIDSLRESSESPSTVDLFGARRLSQQTHSFSPEPWKGAYPCVELLASYDNPRESSFARCQLFSGLSTVLADIILRAPIMTPIGERVMGRSVQSACISTLFTLVCGKVTPHLASRLTNVYRKANSLCLMFPLNGKE